MNKLLFLFCSWKEELLLIRGGVLTWKPHHCRALVVFIVARGCLMSVFIKTWKVILLLIRHKNELLSCHVMPNLFLFKRLSEEVWVLRSHYYLKRHLEWVLFPCLWLLFPHVLDIHWFVIKFSDYAAPSRGYLVLDLHLVFTGLSKDASPHKKHTLILLFFLSIFEDLNHLSSERVMKSWGE